MEQIITSILDTDLYKLTQQKCIFHQHPSATAEYSFKCRNKGVKFGFLAQKVQEQVNAMAGISLTKEEKRYLGTLSFMSPDYLDYLENYRFDPSQVIVCTGIEDDLIINIIGPWVETILWEVPLLSIVNELYFAHISSGKSKDEIQYQGHERLHIKTEIIADRPRFIFADFGTRRRFSKNWQRYVVIELKRICPNNLIGTSNVKLAMELGIKAIGTMAHEFISAHLSLVDNVREAQKRAFYVWLQEYGTNLGIALSDTFTTKAFFDDFDYTLAHNFSGIRQDSGDPIEFGKKAIEHYKKLGIDPRTKSIVFSDGLDIPKAIKIFDEFTGLVGVSFGIGTNLTNDLGLDPLNIVIKLVGCNGKPVVKLSDNMTKAIGDNEVIEKIKKAYKL